MTSDDKELKNRRLHHELEQAIGAINAEVIGAATGGITKQAFVDTARLVATLRAQYLQTLLTLSRESHDHAIEPQAVLELRRLREAYTEVMEGFVALEHALQRGYLRMED